VVKHELKAEKLHFSEIESRLVLIKKQLLELNEVL
jgi:hypothetical protein